jgi:hypothetical protein
MIADFPAFIAFAVIGAALCLVVAGCSAAPPKQTEFMKSVEGLEITKRQLQTIMYQYAAHYADGVDLDAVAIYEQAEDPRIRRNAIVWKTNSVPIMMKHCFNDEPLAALIFAWAYANQVAEFFETGRGTDFFGPHQEIAIEASTRLEGELEDIAMRLLPEPRVRAFRERLTEWTSEHPIDITLAAIERLMTESRLAMGEAFVAMDGSIDGVVRRAILLLALPATVLLVLLIVVMIWIRNTVNRMLVIGERRLDRSS